MANIKLGSQAGWSKNYAQNLDSDYQLTPGDSGKVFFVDATSTVTVNLPKLSADIAGWNCRMILDVEGSSVVKVVAYGLPAAGGTSATAADAESVTYHEHARDGSNSGTVTNVDGYQFTTSATLGHSVNVFTNGTRWFVDTFQGAHAHGAGVDSD